MASKKIKTTFSPFITMVASTFFVIAFVYSVSFVLETLSRDIQKGVTVAGISISELPKTIAKEKIENETNNWKEAYSVSFRYLSQEISISNQELFFFDIEETLQNRSNKSEWPLIVYLNDQQINHIVTQLMGEDYYKELNRSALNDDLENLGQQLLNKNLVISLHDYLDEELEIVSSSTNTAIFKTNDFIKTVFFFDGLQFEAKEEFSFSDFLRKNQNDSIHDQVYSIIASAIYQLILPTNFEIIERHISDTLPAYSELGFEAKVDRGKDLKFYNPNATPYTVHFFIEEDVLKAALTGIPFKHTYQIELSDHLTTDYKTDIQTDMSITGIKTIQKGQVGQEITVHRKRIEPSGQSELQWISHDSYPPVKNIEVHGQAGTKQRGGKGN